MIDAVTILYIEDNRDNQLLVRRILESRGYALQICEDGPSGIALARESQPALILVDINIAGMDGYETTTRLRSLPHLQSTPIVAITADARPGTRERALAAGCDGFITKPIDPRLLPEQIAEFLGGKRELLPTSLETIMLREYNARLVERLERQVRELSARNAELQELDRLKNTFLATLSHELRTPLTAILGYLELFERRTLGSLNDVQGQAINVIARNARTLSRILNNLLYLQEVRSTEIRRAPVVIHEVLQEVIEDMQPLARAANVTLSASLQPTAVYMGDPIGISQALRALIDNAIKFTPPSGRVDVTLIDEPSRVLVRVEDTGIGIPAEAQEKIFLPFYQIDDTLARPYSGAGLGLAIARHVVEAHGGHLTVRSVVQAGSTFTVVLPRE
ncbi:response regulator receiver sensor signal transduction histidine kinase [Roseiflexus castenholzii DSM 13941]|jgi:signal transduction histidine kinase|uniref:histidine kinase n=1 Tax=Roseiflexus castenholzii (strain DSM 13941 / HLO8) TaxID=383372 RepID=A7NJR8_ROSCS|nr:response regulator receiver sensor signal transduction histidine kinase [Roseiflexus castenholzii DSM 13941]